MTFRNRRTAARQRLYSLLDDRNLEDAAVLDRTHWYRGRSAPTEDAAARHRAAWRSNVRGAGAADPSPSSAWRHKIDVRNQ